jgi:hypothetical protein
MLFNPATASTAEPRTAMRRFLVLSRRARMMIKGMPTETSSVFSAAADAQQRGE